MSLTDVTGTERQTHAFYRRTMFAPVRPSHHSVSLTAPLQQTIAEINRVQPDLIWSYGTFAELLFRTVAACGIHLHRPKVLVYGSDLLTPGGRRLIEEEMGIPVISRYNCVESFKIGFLCEERRAFHLHDDLCHLRVVDSAGRTVPDGTRGEVVISNLVNRGTVLLNYRLGDLATIVTEPCGCGRTTRLLSELEGRVSELIHLADGTMISPTEVWDVVEPYREVIRYQLVQQRRDQFDLQLVAADEAAYDRIAAPLAAGVARLLAGARVDPSYHPAETSPDLGKFKRVVALPPAETTP
jgi:phenylacetate-CoA ligase